MDNWFMDRNEIKRKTINAIMDELEYLLGELTEGDSANYWLDNTHNVFAFINDNGNGDRWIEIHYELYDCNEDIIGDLLPNQKSINLIDLLIGKYSIKNKESYFQF